MPKCRVNACTVKQAIFNIIGETSGVCCSAHKDENMIDVINKKCVFENCTTRPTYNYENEKSGLYCAKHKLENMINVLNNKCIFENCTTLTRKACSS